MNKKILKLFLIIAAILISGLILFSIRTVFFTGKTPETPQKTRLILVHPPDPKNPPLFIEFIDEQGALRFEKKDGIFWPVSDPLIQFEAFQIKRRVKAVLELEAEEIIDRHPADYQEYGLDKPQLKIILGYANGKTQEFLLGKQTPTRQHYYLKRADNDSVFLLRKNLGDRLNMEFNHMRKRNIARLDIKNISQIELKGPKAQMKIVPRADRHNTEYTGTFSDFVMEKPYSIPRGVLKDKLNTFLERFKETSVREFIKDHPKDLTEYGLAPHQRIELLIKDKKGNTLHLYLGKKNKDERSYAMVPGTATVFLLPNLLVDFQNLSPFYFIEKYFQLIGIQTVENIKLKTEQGFYKINIEQKEWNKKTEQYNLRFSINNIEIPEKDFKAFYSQLIGLMADGVIKQNEKPDPKAEITILFKRRDNAPDVEIRLLPLDKHFYALALDNKIDFKVSRYQLDKMLEKLQKITQLL